MYTKLWWAGIVLVVLGIGVWFALRAHDSNSSVSAMPKALDASSVSSMLPGTVLHVPVNTTQTVDITLDTYILGGEKVIGGATSDKNPDVVAHVIVPDLTQALPHGAWVYDHTIGTERFVLMPVYINFGGTGTFLMIALFSYNEKNGTLTHRDLNFIDDRVVFEGFETGANGTIAVHYLTRKEGDAMSDAPTHAVVRELRVEGSVLHTVE